MVFAEELTNTEAKAAPLAQVENCKRLSAVEKETSALHKNIADKGGNAYYFAHSRQYEIPADAKIITGPGLVAGGPPQRLSGPDGTPVGEQTDVSFAAQAPMETAETSPKKEIEKEAIALTEYSWSDDGDKVKVYVTCDGLPAGATESLVNASFGAKSIKLEIETVPRRKFKIDKLHKEISPDDCKVRINAAKGKITVTLVKKRAGSWYQIVDNK
eukprot:TRINITY_DN1797_c0_g1_i1.p1 TRINITY_DN1797_c0_g1~~TRINITY_DN1797_c0_g1_i1.p1  ORF type:complete len:215 (+),score=44.80 TRINITY_DN1797_c0_g1_i1:74-718(+)